MKILLNDTKKMRKFVVRVDLRGNRFRDCYLCGKDMETIYTTYMHQDCWAGCGAVEKGKAKRALEMALRNRLDTIDVMEED